MKYNLVNVTDAYKDCKTEQQFKTAWISLNKRYWKKLWSIETEETVSGFPDVMAIDFENKVHFFEFKIADKYGNFHYQPTQPAFYRQNKDLPIHTIVLVNFVKVPFYLCFNAQFIFEGNLISNTSKAQCNANKVIDFVHLNNRYKDNDFEIKSVTGGENDKRN